MSSDIIRIADHLWAIKTYMGRHATEGPFVTSFLGLGRIAVLFDSGLSWTTPDILDLLRRLGRAPTDLKLILNSHAHWDHIGANAPLKEATGCLIVSEPSGVHWIEDHHRQHREFYEAFPDCWLPTDALTQEFFDAVGPETGVEIHAPGDFTLLLGDDVAWDVFGTPGHISSCISVVDRGTGALLTGDSFQWEGFYGNIPQYDGVAGYRETLRLYAARDPKWMLTAHTAPVEGGDVMAAIRASGDMVQAIEDEVRASLRLRGGPAHLRDITERVVGKFGRDYTIQALCTIDGHLRDLETAGRVRRAEPGANAWLG